jgi:hypothetical protein
MPAVNVKNERVPEMVVESRHVEFHLEFDRTGWIGGTLDTGRLSPVLLMSPTY